VPSAGPSSLTVCCKGQDERQSGILIVQRDPSSLLSETFPAIDPLAPLALSIQANRRVFALFLGSGLSVSSGIPTGRDVVHLLIRKLACALGQDCGEDPETWFHAEFGDDPDYSRLLSDLYPAPSERRNALNDFFEPNELDIIHGRKQPTPAHQSIAELVKQGYFQVILTTNFDRLLERAFSEAGVAYTVVRSAEEAARIDPLQHIQIIIIKINGDYKDPDLRNTEEEVREYPAEMERLLQRIFSEYGLIICGWSSTSDSGLRDLLASNPSRYSTYWATRGELAEEAQPILEARNGFVVPIEDADTFFHDLEMKVTAIDRMTNGLPLTAGMAAESVKVYLGEDRWAIPLRDLVVRETRSVCSTLLSMNAPENIPDPTTSENLGSRIIEYDAVLSTLISITIPGCFYGKPEHHAIWGQSLDAVTKTRQRGLGAGPWLRLQDYPALCLLYAGGIAALAAKNYDLLRVLLVDTKIRVGGREVPVVMEIYPGEVLKNRQDVAIRVHGSALTDSQLPLSDALQLDLASRFTDIVLHNEEYQRLFDHFEYFRCLVHADWHKRLQRDACGSFGGFIQRADRYRYPHNPFREIDIELERDGEDWSPLRAGFFEGSIERIREIKTEYDTWLRSIRNIGDS
jgi:hypothetical protein